LKVRRL